MMTEMRFHPVSGLFLEMSEAEFEALVTGIAIVLVWHQESSRDSWQPMRALI